MQIRQGDLLFEKLDWEPTGSFLRSKENIIEYGEETGHAHALATPGTADLMVREGTNQVDYLNVLNPTTIIHDTHKSVDLSEGIWVVIRQKSLDLRERGVSRYVND